jgi:hypothetical protein
LFASIGDIKLLILVVQHVVSLALRQVIGPKRRIVIASDHHRRVVVFKLLRLSALLLILNELGLFFFALLFLVERQTEPLRLDFDLFLFIFDYH